MSEKQTLPVKDSLFKQQIRKGMKDWRYRLGWIEASVELWWLRVQIRIARWLFWLTGAEHETTGR